MFITAGNCGESSDSTRWIRKNKDSFTIKALVPRGRDSSGSFPSETEQGQDSLVSPDCSVDKVGSV